MASLPKRKKRPKEGAFGRVFFLGWESKALFFLCIVFEGFHVFFPLWFLAVVCCWFGVIVFCTVLGVFSRVVLIIFSRSTRICFFPA